jgi:hypothetical protein
MTATRKMRKSKPLPAGGVATSIGMDYEFRVAAWFAVHILAEQDITLPWNFPSKETFENLRLETEYPVDDLLVNTSDSGRIFLQVKHNLRMERNKNSSLASSIDQIVRQFLAGENPTPDHSHLLNLDRDRFVIITSPNASSEISNTTYSLLDHLRNQTKDLNVPQSEQHCLDVLSAHVKYSWNSMLGSDPSEGEIRKLLNYLYIHILDVDSNGKDELFCKHLFRNSILKTANDANVAWATLISHCAELARLRGGSDRIKLQRVLINAGINLKIPNSFREDVEQLKEFTELTLSSVASLSKIFIGSDEIKVNRAYISTIQKAVNETHLLIVGEPGSGKSGVLHDFVELLRQQNEDVVFFAVDRLNSPKLSDEADIKNTIYKILLNWPGVRPGFLVIDALDGARNEQTAQFIKTLIERVIKELPRWRVVASVRKFDLRHNLELRGLFRGEPIADNMDPEFESIRHINIQDFNESELDQIRSQSEALASLLKTEDPALTLLLKKPFNLRLIGELFGEGISADKLTPVRTQVELLSKYWFYRVLRNDGFGDARELVLRRATSEMLKDHSLRVDRSIIVQDVNSGPFLQELLSSHVLVEWRPSPKSQVDRYVLAFAHNMLYDYAISKLIFSGNNQKLVKKLEEDHELILAVHPSIVYYFHELWFSDSSLERFWDAVTELMKENQVPLIGKLIGPSVAVELAGHSNDFNFVFQKLESKDQSDINLAYKILRDITGAILTYLPEGGVSDDKSLVIWGQFIERISRSINKEIAYSVRAILMKLCEQPKWLKPDHKNELGKAARRVLEFAWSQDEKERDEGLIAHAIKAVCRTYEGDPNASKALLQQSLESNHLQKYGFQEMPRLADEIEALVVNDPGLVEEIYIKVFAYKESSEETTSMGGRILGFLSTKRQDFSMARWSLGEAYQFFIDKFPTEAVRALIAIAQSYVTEKHEEKINEILSFMLGDTEAKMATDYSAIWDSGSDQSGDETVRILNIFSTYLQRIVSDPGNDRLIRVLVALIAQQNQTAVIWNKLLIVATGAPSTLGKTIRSLAWAKPLLLGIDTTTAAGNFIREIYEYLDYNEKTKVEETILSITKDTSDSQNSEYVEHNRNRLLGCIADKELVTEEARKIAHKLLETGKFPPNTPPFSIEGGWSKVYTDEDYLRDQGVSLKTDKHRTILEFQKILKEFDSKYQNAAPPLSVAIEILPTMLDLEAALSKDPEKIDERVKDLAWGYLAQTCERIANILPLDHKSQLGENVERLLQILADYPIPSPSPEQDAQFSKSQSWGSPAARIDAASGLILLARSPDYLDEEFVGYIERLARDDVASVRFQIATKLNALVNIAPDLMWSNLNYFATEENNNGVIKGVFGPLNRLAGMYPDEVVKLTESIFARTIDNDNDTEPISHSCLSIFLGLHLWRDQLEAGRQISLSLDQKEAPIGLKVHIVNELRNALSEYKDASVRKRAIKIMEKIVQDCVNDFQITLERLQQNNLQDDRNYFKDVIRLADSAAMNIYFSSGAFAEKGGQKSSEKILSIDEKRIFLVELSHIILSLSQITYASVTHHLIETLELLVPANPRDVFLLVNSVVKAGKVGGYQYEYLAVDHIVQIVERYLAEYRQIIRESIDCQNALLEILDTFVAAGWPTARKLTYRLEEIYR